MAEVEVCGLLDAVELSGAGSDGGCKGESLSPEERKKRDTWKG
jgi:hypothetical protein